MVVIPQVLDDVLRKVEFRQAAELSIAFAERTLDRLKSGISPGQASAALSYLSIARDVVAENGSMDALASAHRAFHASRESDDARSKAIGWLAAMAVSASCQREMEQAGIVERVRFQPTVIDVAHEAQRIAAQFSPEGPNGVAATRIRWEVARQQLIEAIESVPMPR